MATFNVDSPDQGATVTVALRFRSFGFGDGYSQDVADGINNLVQTYNLVFSNRPQATIQAIDDFLRGQLGQWFYWVTPRGETLRFKCKTWTPNYQVSTSRSLSCVFEQCFEP